MTRKRHKGCGMYMGYKGVCLRYVLDALESRKFKVSVKNIVTADVRVMCMPIHIWYRHRCMASFSHAPEGDIPGAFFHTGVELHVVRSIDTGNARASVRGTATAGFPRFYFSVEPSCSFTSPASGGKHGAATTTGNTYEHEDTFQCLRRTVRRRP